MNKINVIKRLEEIETLKNFIPTYKTSRIKPSQIAKLYYLIKGFASELIEDCNIIYKYNFSSSLVELTNSLASLCNIKKILKAYTLNDRCEDERLCYGMRPYLITLRKNLSSIERIFRSFELT